MRKQLRRVVLATFVVVAAAGVAAQRSPGPSTAATLREQALAHLDRNETREALAAVDAGLKRWPADAGLLAATGRIYWRVLRTKSAEEALIQAAKNPAYAAEAQYWLGRIYYFKGWQAENAFPGWHEEVSYRPRAIAAFTAARDLKPDWDLPRAALAQIENPQPPPFSDPAVDALDAELKKYAAKANAPSAAETAAAGALVDKRLALRPDPAAYAAAANLLLAWNVELPRVEQLAETGRTAGERFIRENESSYKLDGKVQGSLDRNAALFLDIAGWAAYRQKRINVAERRLAEAERLFRGLDPTNQLHLAELSRDKKNLDVARDHYLNVLTLAAAPPPVRDAAKNALAELRKAEGENPAEFETWLAGTLDRLRQERRKALVSSMIGKPAPALHLTDLQGHPVDLQAERGNVILLNFFSAW